MDYDALEVEIVNKLKAYFTATELSAGILLSTVFDSRQMPEDDAEFKRVADKAIVNVLYADSQYQKPENTSAISQVETITLSLFLQGRQLRGGSGVLKLLGHVKKCLLGYKPSNSRNRLYISGSGTWTIDEGGTLPFLEFSFDTFSNQVAEAPASMGGNLVSATVKVP